MRAIDADAFAEFIKYAIKTQKYDALKVNDTTLTVEDVLASVVAELKGTGIDGFKNNPTIEPEQPERLTDDDFETIRIHLNAYKENLCNQQRWKEAEEYQRIIDRFMAFASAQPEPIRLYIDHMFTEEEYEKLKQKIADSPIVLMPYKKPKVIHCKDCVYWDSLPSSLRAPEYHECVKRPFHENTTADDFCSRAERR